MRRRRPPLRAFMLSGVAEASVMVRRSSSLRSVLAAGAAAFLLASCGGGSSNPNNPNPNPSPTATPTPVGSPVHTVLLGGVGFVLNPTTAMFRNVDNPPVGQLDITVNWDGGGATTSATAGASFAGFQTIRGALFTTPGTGFTQSPLVETAGPADQTLRFRLSANGGSTYHTEQLRAHSSGSYHVNHAAPTFLIKIANDVAAVSRTSVSSVTARGSPLRIT